MQLSLFAFGGAPGHSQMFTSSSSSRHGVKRERSSDRLLSQQQHSYSLHDAGRDDALPGDTSASLEMIEATMHPLAKHCEQPPPTVAQRSKRRQEGASNWALVLPFDDVFRPVWVDLRLLRQFDCRMLKHIETDPPDYTVEGHDTWRVTMGRSLLVALMKCLLTHEFFLPADVDYHEAIKALEYEGIPVPGNRISETATKHIGPTAMGIGMRRPEQHPDEVMRSRVQTVTCALLEWPRLDYGFTMSSQGHDVGFTCTSTQCWIRFGPKPPKPQPHDATGPDDIYLLAKKRPRWLTSTLLGIGLLHHRLVGAARLDTEARDEDAFLILNKEATELDPLHYFLSARRDIPHLEKNPYKIMTSNSEKWAMSVIGATIEHGAIRWTAEGKPDTPDNVKYARACVSLAVQLVHSKNTPDCSKLFRGIGGETPDGKKDMLTPERRALDKALRLHPGIKIIRWSEDTPPNVTPLVFPPSHLSSLVSGGPCVLLEYSPPKAAR